MCNATVNLDMNERVTRQTCQNSWVLTTLGLFDCSSDAVQKRVQKQSRAQDCDLSAQKEKTGSLHRLSRRRLSAKLSIHLLSQKLG